MGVAPTGKTVNSAGTLIDRVVRGKIVEEWSQWDTLGMMQQLGLMPEVKAVKLVAV